MSVPTNQKDPAASGSQPEGTAPWDLFLRDQLGKPIPFLDLWLHVDGKELMFTTKADGSVSGIPRSLEPIKVDVKKHTGGRKTVAEVKLMPHTPGVVLSSPKIKIEGRTRIHELGGAKPTVDPVKQAFKAAKNAAPPQTTGDNSEIEVAVSDGYFSASTSGSSIDYTCHSQDPREKYLWRASPHIQAFAQTSPAGYASKPGKLTMWVLGLGGTFHTRDQQGHPVTVVALEGWDNRLALGANEKWRPALQEAMALDSVKKTGIKIFALAALINSEAGTNWIKQVEMVPAKDKKGNPVVDPKSKKPLMKKRVTRVDGGWNEAIHNTSDPKSDAAGLTQFIKSSWCAMAVHPGTQLGKYARQRGWVVEKEILAGEKKIKFLDPDLTKRLERLNEARKIGMKPKTVKRWFAKDETSYNQLLKLREDGRMSILTAAEAMAMNFDTLKRGYGLKVDNITNPFEVAKLAYYFHFLGPDRGVKLIKGTMDEKTAERLLCAQFNDGEAGAIRAGHLSTISSNERWQNGIKNFASYICNERLLDGFNKYCQPIPTSQEIGDDLLQLFKRIH